MADAALLKFLEFLDHTDKSQLQAYADRVTITQTHLVSLILACDVGTVPIGHVAFHRQFHPQELDLTEENRRALAENGVGVLGARAQKAVNKVMQTFQQRRLFSAHFFWLLAHPGEWHLFYFDQRDTSGDHWVGGAHMHLMNHLTHPQLNPRDLLDRIHADDRPPKLSGVHVRYLRD